MSSEPSGFRVSPGVLSPMENRLIEFLTSWKSDPYMVIDQNPFGSVGGIWSALKCST